MVSAPTPPNEAERLRTLQLFRLLDTGSEKALDDLTQLAAAICEAPISLVSLVDQDRQWFKARVGLDIHQTSRDVSFCAHAILEDDMLVVADATADPRFADNGLVLADPSIRFYAGAPLVMADGHALGALCVMDRRPRELSATQQQALRTLRQAVVTQLELRRALDDFRSLERLLPICAWCRKVHNADGSWTALHDYVANSIKVTHGMCPDCAEAF